MRTSKQDLSMGDLLASCAAASAVSTPPASTTSSPADGTEGTERVPRVHEERGTGAERDGAPLPAGDDRRAA
ncbi:hypothetical protein [Streptomyces sp. NPDC015131]|uniref:hypothetical protein n=1 Tax=Streptomyces sp. NPDC015131 TaxID=3364941 RepID=UPI0036F58CA2